ncbi:hypothetical protein [Pseudoruegeria sp. HB172150]|uniref:hypothetical protein n=1 Tax=Pseudoruegeria sp. HB172150 TaxID=2721164 RepID=UPI001556FE04|nr:hypothetical protein [Pseudoruegeria sp. HB172150]
MDTGTVISGAGHGLLLAWLMFGGLLQSAPDDPVFDSADVSLVSAEEYAALTRQAVPTEEQPDATVDVPAPVVPEVESSPPPQVRPSEPPEVQETPEVAEPETVEDTPVPVEEPPAPEAEVADTPPPEITPPVEDIPLPEPAPLAEEAQPREAPRVAPIPVPDAPDAPEIADTPAPRVSPDANTDVVAEEQPDAAPEEATTEIVTEAEKPTAPERSPVPTQRPIVTASAQPEPEPEPQPEPAPGAPTAPEPPAEEPAEDPVPEAPETDPLADAIAGAVDDALNEPTEAAPTTPAGPPMSSSEKEGLRVAVQQCWNTGSLSTEALQTTVVVSVSMNRDGTPDTSSIRMLDSRGGSSDAAARAFEAARRAIIRCGSRGFPLPAEKFDQWREIEMTFDPSGMRMK